MDISRTMAIQVDQQQHSSGKEGEEEPRTQTSPDKAATQGECEDEVGEEGEAPSQSRYDYNFPKTCIIL